MDGGGIAHYLSDALYNLGFPWNKVGDEGLKIVDRFESSEEGDEEMFEEMREYFRTVKKDPPSMEPLTFETHFGPSEYIVVDGLISSLEDLAGSLPDVAEPIYDIFKDYQAHLKSVKAPKRLRERLSRLWHSVSDLEDHAAGRA